MATTRITSARENERRRKDAKNASARQKRSIRGLVDQSHRVGRLYNCKVYIIIQTERGRVMDYNNAAHLGWPPKYHQIGHLFPVAERLGPRNYGLTDGNVATTKPSSHNLHGVMESADGTVGDPFSVREPPPASGDLSQVEFIPSEWMDSLWDVPALEAAATEDPVSQPDGHQAQGT